MCMTYGLNRTEIAGPASNPVALINVVASSVVSSSIIPISSLFASGNTPTLSDTDSTSNTSK